MPLFDSETQHLINKMVGDAQIGPGVHITAPTLAKVMLGQLSNKVIPTTPSFLQILIPPETLPFEVTLEFLVKAGIYEEGKCTIPLCLDDKVDVVPEAILCTFLNTLVRKMRQHAIEKGLIALNDYAYRVWTHRNHNKIPAGSGAGVKPDILLLDPQYLQHLLSFTTHIRTQWAAVAAFGEVTRSLKRLPALQDTVNTKSAVIFQTQPNRRYVVALSFVGRNLEDLQMNVTVTDRSGQIQAHKLGIMGLEFIHFARFILGLAGNPVEYLGLDPTMSQQLDGSLEDIYVENRVYQHVATIHSMKNLFSRGTWVFLVSAESKYFIIKDLWSATQVTEAEFLEHISGHPKYHAIKFNVPRMDASTTIKVRYCLDQKADSTSLLRQFIPPDESVPRIHTRYSTETLGDPLTSFRSKKELVGAMRDIIRCEPVYLTHGSYTNKAISGMGILHDDMGILHTDISINNLMLHRRPTKDPFAPEVHGLLIDFDYATYTSKRNMRQGTVSVSFSIYILI